MNLEYLLSTDLFDSLFNVERRFRKKGDGKLSDRSFLLAFGEKVYDEKGGKLYSILFCEHSGL